MPPYHILVVDDQKDVRRVLRAGLETLGSRPQVLEVPSGEEAQLVFSQQPVDLLVTDIRLAGMSGLELLHKARASAPEMRVILITGLTDERTRQAVGAAGADACFYKPLEMSPFLEAVDGCLSQLTPSEAEKAPAGEASPGRSNGRSMQPEVQAADSSPVDRTNPPHATAPIPASRSVFGEADTAFPAPIGGAYDPQEFLSELCQSTGALSAGLLDNHGQVVGMIGRLDGFVFDDALASALQALLSASDRVAAALPSRIWMDNAPEILCFPAGSRQVWAVRAGKAGALLVVTEIEPGGPWSAAAGALRLAAGNLRGLSEGNRDFSRGEIRFPAAVSERPGDPAEIDDRLAALFQGAAHIHLDGQDVSDFWDMVAEDSGSSEEILSRGISFEQACQLGLASEEDLE